MNKGIEMQIDASDHAKRTTVEIAARDLAAAGEWG